MPERFEMAVHRGDWCALCMGLALLFIRDSPRLDITHDSLPTVRYVDMLNYDRLLPAVAMLAQGFHLSRIGARQFRIAIGVCCNLINLPRVRYRFCSTDYAHRLAGMVLAE
jgi:hypothetical protein